MRVNYIREMFIIFNARVRLDVAKSVPSTRLFSLLYHSLEESDDSSIDFAFFGNNTFNAAPNVSSIDAVARIAPSTKLSSCAVA